MNFITVSYADAMQLNEIIFNNYIANVIDLTQTVALVGQFQQAFSDNAIILNPDQQVWLDSLLDSNLWDSTLAQAMIYVSNLRDLLGFPAVFAVKTPFQLNIINYLTGWQDGTYSYYNLFYADPLQMQTLPVTQLVIDASTDPNLPELDRQFIQNLIG